MLPMTFFIDIDGTLCENTREGQMEQCKAELWQTAVDHINYLQGRGHRIILTTGRREVLRHATEHQLFEAGIAFDQLIMDCNPGARVIINDQKPDGTCTAFSISHKRNTTDWIDDCLHLMCRPSNKVSEEADNTGAWEHDAGGSLN
jgi:hydroxymethylpyrimidine pyrophosphatase-like HAD family hydrolase